MLYTTHAYPCGCLSWPHRRHRFQLRSQASTESRSSVAGRRDARYRARARPRRPLCPPRTFSLCIAARQQVWTSATGKLSALAKLARQVVHRRQRLLASSMERAEHVRLTAICRPLSTSVAHDAPRRLQHEGWLRRQRRQTRFWLCRQRFWRPVARTS